MDHPHLPTSPEEEEFESNQEERIRQWEEEQNQKSLMQMALEIKQLGEEMNYDRTTDTDTQ